MSDTRHNAHQIYPTHHAPPRLRFWRLFLAITRYAHSLHSAASSAPGALVYRHSLDQVAHTRLVPQVQHYPRYHYPHLHDLAASHRDWRPHLPILFPLLLPPLWRGHVIRDRGNSYLDWRFDLVLPFPSRHRFDRLCPPIRARGAHHDHSTRHLHGSPIRDCHRSKKSAGDPHLTYRQRRVRYAHLPHAQFETHLDLRARYIVAGNTSGKSERRQDLFRKSVQRSTRIVPLSR